MYTICTPYIHLTHLHTPLIFTYKFSCCPYCEAYNGVVKKVVGVGTLKIVHERYKGKKRQAVEDRANFLDEFDEAKKANPDLETYLGKCQDDLSPSRVRRSVNRLFRGVNRLFRGARTT